MNARNAVECELIDEALRPVGEHRARHRDHARRPRRTRAHLLRDRGRHAPDYLQSTALPTDDQDAAAREKERVLTEWDSELWGVGVHLRTITRDGWVCASYRPGFVHDGTEGELYDLGADPLHQQPSPHTPRLDVEAPV